MANGHNHESKDPLFDAFMQEIDGQEREPLRFELSLSDNNANEEFQEEVKNKHVAKNVKSQKVFEYTTTNKQVVEYRGGGNSDS